MILEMMGGGYVARNLKAAAMDCRIVPLAFRQGPEVTVNLMPVMLKRLTLTGSTLRPRSDAFKAAVAAELAARVWPLFGPGRIRGRLRAVTHAALPFAEAARAHEVLEAGRRGGRTSVTP